MIMCNISAAGVLYIQRHDHSIRGGRKNVFDRIIIVRDSGYRTDSFSGELSVSGIYLSGSAVWSADRDRSAAVGVLFLHGQEGEAESVTDAGRERGVCALLILEDTE